MSPRRGPLVTTSENTLDIRPRIASGVTVWLMIWRQTALTLSAAPATREQRGRDPQRGVAPGQRDRGAPDRHRDDHDAARGGSTWSSQPRGQRRDRRSRRDRREQQARPARARVVDAHRQHREQRARHAERHRHQVDRERAQQRLLAPHEAAGPSAIERPIDGRSSPWPCGSCGAHPEQREDHREAADRVDAVGHLDAAGGDQQAAERRAEDHRQLVEPEVHRQRGRQPRRARRGSARSPSA